MDQTSVKHLVVVTTSFPDVVYQSGQEAAGTFVSDFAAELARQVRVTVVAPGAGDGVERPHAQLRIQRFQVPSLPLSLLKPTNPRQWRAIAATLRAGQRAVDTAVADAADAVFALWALPSGQWARRAAARAGIPYGIWALGSDIWSLGGVPLVRGVLRDVLRSAAWRFADGYQLAADVSALSGLDCAFLPSTRVLPLPGEKQLAGAPPYKLAFLGRWHPHKGVDLLLESLQLLEDADWQRIAAVQICGGGPLEPLVQAQGAALGGNGRPVTIRGYLNRAEAAELLTWADYLLLPSRIESIPVIFSDAMQARCPVVAMPVGDLPRLMESGDAGILVQHVTAEALATGIRRALAAAPVQFEPGLRRLRAQFDLPRAVSQLTAQVL